MRLGLILKEILSPLTLVLLSTPFPLQKATLFRVRRDLHPGWKVHCEPADARGTAELHRYSGGLASRQLLESASRVDGRKFVVQFELLLRRYFRILVKIIL